MLDFQASRWLCDNNVAGQAGNNHPTSVPTGVFKTSDGSINLAVAGKQFGDALLRQLTKEIGLKWKNLKMQKID